MFVSDAYYTLLKLKNFIESKYFTGIDFPEATYFCYRVLKVLGVKYYREYGFYTEPMVIVIDAKRQIEKLYNKIDYLKLNANDMQVKLIIIIDDTIEKIKP